jgi:hypothetical protein
MDLRLEPKTSSISATNSFGVGLGIDTKLTVLGGDDQAGGEVRGPLGAGLFLHRDIPKGRYRTHALLQQQQGKTVTVRSPGFLVNLPKKETRGYGECCRKGRSEGSGKFMAAPKRNCGVTLPITSLSLPGLMGL